MPDIYEDDRQRKQGLCTAWASFMGAPTPRVWCSLPLGHEGSSHGNPIRGIVWDAPAPQDRPQANPEPEKTEPTDEKGSEETASAEITPQIAMDDLTLALQTLVRRYNGLLRVEMTAKWGQNPSVELKAAVQDPIKITVYPAGGSGSGGGGGGGGYHIPPGMNWTGMDT